jgi:predicted  nucleic acid-binding Zn-ribbon protein
MSESGYAVNRCPKCKKTFRTMVDEVGMHECPNCGYFPDDKKRYEEDSGEDKDQMDEVERMVRERMREGAARIKELEAEKDKPKLTPLRHLANQLKDLAFDDLVCASGYCETGLVELDSNRPLRGFGWRPTDVLIEAARLCETFANVKE